MKDIRWFGARSAGETGVGLMQSLFGPLFRSAAPVDSFTPAPSRPRIGDAGADACWTASLRRGDDLPPFLLSIHAAAGTCSSMRFEPFDKGAGTESLGPEL